MCKFERLGMTRQQAEALTHTLTDVLCANRDQLAQSYVSVISLDKTTLEQEARQAGFRSEVLKSQELQVPQALPAPPQHYPSNSFIVLRCARALPRQIGGIVFGGSGTTSGWREHGAAAADVARSMQCTLIDGLPLMAALAAGCPVHARHRAAAIQLGEGSI